MFIDIGASSIEEAEEMGIRIGDPVVPESRFSTMTKTVFKEILEKSMNCFPA